MRIGHSSVLLCYLRSCRGSGAARGLWPHVLGVTGSTSFLFWFLFSLSFSLPLPLSPLPSSLSFFGRRGAAAPSALPAYAPAISYSSHPGSIPSTFIIHPFLKKKTITSTKKSCFCSNRVSDIFLTFYRRYTNTSSFVLLKVFYFLDQILFFFALLLLIPMLDISVGACL